MKDNRVVCGGLVFGIIMLVLITTFFLGANACAAASVEPAVEPRPVPTPPAIAVTPFATGSTPRAGADLAPEPLPVPRPQVTPAQPGTLVTGSASLWPLSLVVASWSLALWRARHGLTMERARERGRAPQPRLATCQECG